MKKKKTGRVIVCTILAILICAGTVFTIWQWSNIKLFLYAKWYSPEQRLEMLLLRQKNLQKKVEEEMQISLNPLSKEEETLLRKGTISDEEALRIIKGETTSEAILSAKEDPEVPEAESGTKSGESEASAEPKKKDNGNLPDLLAQVYLLRAEFTGRIDGLIAQGKADYVASKGKESKLSIAQRYLAQGNALEVECDRRMDALLSQIESEIQRVGGDKSLPDEINATYEEEKNFKKAELLEKYN